jgi:hypothetical protein
MAPLSAAPIKAGRVLSVECHAIHVSGALSKAGREAAGRAEVFIGNSFPGLVGLHETCGAAAST